MQSACLLFQHSTHFWRIIAHPNHSKAPQGQQDVPAYWQFSPWKPQEEDGLCHGVLNHGCVEATKPASSQNPTGRKESVTPPQSFIKMSEDKC